MKSRSVFLRAGVLAALLAAATPAVPQAVAATGGGTLHGVVQNTTGEPLANASVRLNEQWGDPVATVTTDAAGRYVAAVAPGTYDVAIDHGSGKAEKHARVDDVVVGPDTPLDIAIPGVSVRPSVFSGRLVDGSGHPLPFVSIWVDLQDTLTDHDGRFTLAVPPGRYDIDLRFDGEDRNLAILLTDFDLTADRTVNWTIPLATVDVTVRDNGGTPRPWFEVNLGNPGNSCRSCTVAEVFPGGPPGRWETGYYTDASGHFRAPALAGPDATLSVDAYQWEQHHSTVAIEAPSAAFDITMRPKSATQPPAQTVQLQGLAVDGAGRPLERVALQNASGGGTVARAEIDGTGQYRISAPPGKYILSGRAHVGNSTPDGDTWESVHIELMDFVLAQDGQSQDLRTSATTTRIRVLDSAKTPVPNAFVTAEYRPTNGTGGNLYSGKWRGSALSVAATDANGVAVVPTIAGAEGTYEVRPPPTGGLETKGKIPVNATDVEVRLTNGVRVEARLRNPDGSIREVDHVSLRTADGGRAPALIPEGEGVYAAQVPEGQYKLSLDGSPDREGESEDINDWSISGVTVDAAHDTVLDLTVPFEPRTASVRFVGSDGRPLDATTGMDATTAPDAISLGPGVTATGNAFISYMGEMDSFDLKLFAPAKVEGETQWPNDAKFSNLAVAPGGDLVIAFPSGTTQRSPEPANCMKATATGPTSATFSWATPLHNGGSPVTGYLVEWTTPTEKRQRFLPADVTSLSVTDLRPDGSNTFVVKPMSASGIGQLSVLVFTTPDGADDRPCLPVPTGPGAPGPGAPGPGGTPQPGEGNPGQGGGPNSQLGTASGPSGYWALGHDGRVYNFGDAPALGNGAANAVDLEPTPTGAGYWLLQHDGKVGASGDATQLGDVDAVKLVKGEEVASLSATPTGKGYWVFTNRGRVIPFGDATFLGDMSTTKLNGPVLGSVATPTGRGYYMVASDGGIFTFGDATFLGSMGGQSLNAPVQDLVPDADGRGYWLVASDGGIFAFDAPFRGSMGAQKLNKPIVGMVRYGDGYLMVGADGGLFNFSSRPFAGSLGDKPPASPIVAVAVLP